jgi:hypothetical protein
MERLFSTATILGTFVLLFRHLRRNEAQAFRSAWVGVLLLVPAWFALTVGPFVFEPRSAAAVAILLALVLEPAPAGMRSRMLVSDVLVLLAILSQAATYFSWGESSPAGPFNIAREWALPYAIGRIFIRTASDLDRSLPGICIAVTALSGLATAEAVLHVNLIDAAVGKDFIGEGLKDASTRWGLKRASGPQMHPIYLGLTLAMFFPWLMEACRRSLSGTGPRWWRWTPLSGAVGIVCTTSRGAQLVVASAVVGELFFRSARWRGVLLATAAAAAVGVLAFREQAVDLLSRYAGEDHEDEGAFVIIDGERYEYTGTRHRDLLSVVYREAIDNVGLLGYGNDKRIPRDAQADDRFISIDNHYLLWRLIFGNLGLATFLGLAGCTIWYLAAAARAGGWPPGVLAGGLCGAMVGAALALRSVWFAPDFGQVWLWTAGVAASLYDLRPGRESNGQY